MKLLQIKIFLCTISTIFFTVHYKLRLLITFTKTDLEKNPNISNLSDRPAFVFIAFNALIDMYSIFADGVVVTGVVNPSLAGLDILPDEDELKRRCTVEKGKLGLDSGWSNINTFFRLIFKHLCFRKSKKKPSL